MNKKVGIWIVLILTSLALVIPSLAIVYNLVFGESQSSNKPLVINPDDVKVSIQTATPSVESTPNVVVSTGEAR